MLLNLVYGALILIASPVLLYRAARQGKYRSGWAEKLLGRVHVPPAQGPRYWFHAVSVGEVNLLGGIVNRLHQVLPDADVVISTSTVTGYGLARRRFPPERVFYCPLDFTWGVRNALDRVDPRVLVLAELEVWPNWVRAAHRRGVFVAVINARLSPRSFRGYGRVERLVRPTFRRLALVAAQSNTYAQRFVALGAPPEVVHVTGSTKYDDAPSTRQTTQIDDFRNLVGAATEHWIWIAGSTQAGEEAVVLDAYRRLADELPNLRLICVPRHAERFDAVASEIRELGFECRRRSQISGRIAEWPSQAVVLVDSIGELRSWWGLANVAFVGGSLGDRGGQNMLEPAGYGAAVCFGPNTENFRDIVEPLLEHQAARRISDTASLAAFVAETYHQRDAAAQMGEAARQVIRQHQGATERTVSLLVDLS